MTLLLLYPLQLLIIPGLMAIPFYFFNKYLIKKIKPRESGKNLLLYFIVMSAAAFAYITIGVFLIIWVGTLLK
ncbi:MAG TPA: hypothetical protein VK484_06305 [Ferruginibacter sp.]|nr:hypothetical protein [Ferruginibacter sp.]